MKLRTLSRLSVITLVILVGAVIYVAHATLASPQAPSLVGTSLGGSPAPSFELTDQRGAMLGPAQLRGAPVVLTFMSLQCTAACDQTAANVREALQELGPAGNHVTVLVVSLDAPADDPGATASFARRLHMTSQWHVLAGSCAALTQVWTEYGVAGEGCSPGVGAAATDALGLYVLDGQGRERVYLDSTFTPSALAGDLRIAGAT